VIIHSTFLDAERFTAMIDVIRAACVRGVRFDLLWGAEKDEETERRNAAAASEIARLVRDDRDLRGRFRVHMRTTGSHAKLILLDTTENGWVAAIGSCNWLSSPFQAVELSVVLRDQWVVADVAVALQRLVGRRGLSDDIATEMAITARDLRRGPSAGGDARVAVVVGDAHDRLIRTASSAAERRFVVGSNRLGSTARPGALLQGEFAAGRDGVKAIVLYTQTTGPLKNRHARALAEEAQVNGLTLTRTRKTPLHGKFVAWDDDDLIVTSLNWASASADPDFPWSEIGVYIHMSGIGAEALRCLEGIFPELAGERPIVDATLLRQS
jgi:phosphatidylserine/phosphatidylglycerophosphate/cardiolipin synthase-like enzyme